MPLSDEDWKKIAAILIEKEVKQGIFLNKRGEPCDFIAFIERGALKAYYTDKKDVATNLLLKKENEFITDYESFLTMRPGKLSVQAIEDSKVILLTKAASEGLYETSFYWNKFGRLVTEGIYLQSKKRTEELLLFSPEERYLALVNEQPEFFQRFALRDIASYLGVTSQSLSRIRARLSKS